MKSKLYKCLINEAINAKKPVRWLLALILIVHTAIIILKKDDLFDAFPTTIIVFLFYSTLFYQVIIEKTLEYLDIAFYRLVKFEGTVIGSGAYHTYRTAPAPGSKWIIEVKGKKRELYDYDPLTAYIRRTHRSKWPTDTIWRGDHVKGVYLKHSKILIELNVIVQEQELKQQHKKRRVGRL